MSKRERARVVVNDLSVWTAIPLVLSTAAAVHACASTDAATEGPDQATEAADTPPELDPGEGAAGEDEEETVAKGFLQTSAQSNAEIFSWSANSADVAMRPVDTHVCFLTRVSGNFGGNSVVAVHRGIVDIQEVWRSNGLMPSSGSLEGGATWKLGGAQAVSNSLVGEATCVPLSDFVLDPGMVTWTSGLGLARASTSRPDCTGSQSVDMWWGNAATYLSFVLGSFNGGGEVAEIIQGETQTPSQVRIHTETCYENFGAGAYSLFVGIPDERGTWRTSHVELDASSDKRRTRRLLKSSEGVCYLTRVSGSLDGGGERIRIYPEFDEYGDEWWTLEARAQGGSAYATAQCVYYDQRNVNECVDLCPR